MAYNTYVATSLPDGLHITNPSPASPKPPSKAYTIATTHPKTPDLSWHSPEALGNPEKTIKISLLRSACNLAISLPSLALLQADVALHLASKHKLYAWEARSHLCRAKCFMEREQWREAKWALVRAAGLHDIKGEIRRLDRKCKKAIKDDERSLAAHKRRLELEAKARAEFEKGALSEIPDAAMMWS